MKLFLPFIIRPYLWLLLFLMMADSCAVNPVTGKKELMFMSEDQEIALGVESNPSILAEFGEYEDATLQKFINDKGQEMARISHRPGLKYEFQILDSPVVNAFALPGGFVYFTRGIMAHFNNEAEFSGVLGHEIGHVTARHGASQQSKQILVSAGLMLGMVVSKDFQQFADVAGAGAQLLFLKFSRDDESQSDKLGVEYSTKIGYDAKEMAGFFKTLDRLSGGSEGRVPSFLSTHPNPADRNVKVGQMAKEMQSKTPEKKFNVNRDSYLRMIDGLVYGEDPRQGYVENDNFYHPELKFQFPVPQGWQVANSPQQVQMAPKDGKALMIMAVAQEKTLDAAAQAMLTNYKLRQISSKKVTVGGFPAMEVLSEQATQAQQTQDPATNQNQQAQQKIRVLTYLIQYNNLIYQFLGVTAEADYNTYSGRFLGTMQNFRTLSDPDKINRQPERIRIKTIEKNGTLSDALKAFNTPANRMDELSILNGMALTDPVQKGMLIKLVGK
ncbi:MAG: M48 family metalloprotease [Saprospiraceae bacterium]|nr:M48 family metalloprotease [Saprospiraceae bacterium]